MAGKSGGFFKRLKIKQQKAVKKSSRGTTGRTKQARRDRHNANVDLFAAKRQLEQLEDAEHSSASISDGDLASSSSSDFGPISKLGTKHKNPLNTLVSLMGKGAKGDGVAPTKKAVTTRSKRAENLSEDDESDDDEDDYSDEGQEESPGSEDPEGDALDALLTKQEQAELRALEEEAEEDEEFDDEEGDDDEDALPESQWDDLFAGVAGTGVPAKQSAVKGGRNLALAGKVAAQASDDDDEEEDEEDEEDDEGGEEEEEDNESDFHSNASASAGEVASEDDDDDTTVAQPVEAKEEKETRGLYLPDFDLTAAATASVQDVDTKALGAAVVRQDPWYKRFYASKVDGASKASVMLAAGSRGALAPLPCQATGVPAPIADQPPVEMHTVVGELTVAGSPTAATLLQHVISQEKRDDVAVVGGKRARDAASESSAPPAGHHPAFVHPTIWTAWCGYRYKLFLEQQRMQHSLSTSGGGALNDDLVASGVDVGDVAPTAAVLEACGRLTDAENTFFGLLQTYSDVMDNTNRWETTFAKRSLVALHLLNHWCKSKTLVAAHNQAIRTAAKEKKAAKQARKAAGLKKGDEGDVDDIPMLEFRDQGFGKTRLMVVLPMRNLALEMVETILRILHSTEGLPRTPKETPAPKAGKTKRVPVTTPARPDLAVRDILADTMGHELAAGVVRNGDPYRIHESSKLLPTTVESAAQREAVTAPHDLIALADRAYHYISPKAVKKIDVFRRDFSEIEEALLLRTFRKRGEDFRRTFYGNMDDSFCFGLSLGLPLTNPTSKSPCASAVYSHVLNSDILICSPLGLRKRLQRNADILVSLSSIEVLMVGEVQGLLMQNWDHLAEVLKLLNARPKDTTQGLSPISRIYDWAIRTTVQIRSGASGSGSGAPQPIGGLCRRQNIFMSTVANATAMATFRSQQSFEEEGAGKREPLDLLKTSSIVISPVERTGVLSQVTLRTRQLFMRYQPTSIASADDERFTYFTKTLFRTKLQPLIDRDVRCIVVVPSYFDFVRLRTHFLHDLRESVAFLNEYSTDKQQRKVLGQFSDQEKCLLIMTERFYYFKRYFVRMAEQLVFYSPPIIPQFYPALVNKLNDDSPHVSASVVFGRYDSHELVRLVGTERCKQLLERESDVFAFVTEA